MSTADDIGQRQKRTLSGPVRVRVPRYPTTLSQGISTTINDLNRYPFPYTTE